MSENNETNDALPLAETHLNKANQRQRPDKGRKSASVPSGADREQGTAEVGNADAGVKEERSVDRCSSDSDAVLVSFGSKLRTVRKSVKKMTLQQLAKRADISPALLSQIERGATSPSLRTLTKLRTALDLSSSFFFDDENPATDTSPDPDYVCRSHTRPVLALGPGEPGKELLHHGGSRVFEFMIITIPPHGTSDPISYPSEKGGYVLEGQLGLVVDERATFLEPGDSFLFDGIRTHSIYNPTDMPAKVLWIIAKLSVSSSF